MRLQESAMNSGTMKPPIYKVMGINQMWCEAFYESQIPENAACNHYIQGTGQRWEGQQTVVIAPESCTGLV